MIDDTKKKISSHTEITKMSEMEKVKGKNTNIIS